MMEYITVKTDNIVYDLNFIANKFDLRSVLITLHSGFKYYIKKEDITLPDPEDKDSDNSETYHIIKEIIRQMEGSGSNGIKSILREALEGPEVDGMYTYSAAYPDIPGDTTLIHYEGLNGAIELEFNDRIDFNPILWQLDC